MDDIRWLLLIVGVVVILLVYVFTRLQGRGRDQAGIIEPDEPDHDDYDPLFDVPGSDSQVERELEQLERLITEDQPQSQTRDSSKQKEALPVDDVVEPAGKVVTLFVLAPKGVPFGGNLIANAMDKAGLKFGDMDVFHRYENVNGVDEQIFSVASMMEPGTFDFGDMDSFSTPGLALFLQLPTAVDAISAFDDMVKTARSLSIHLEGTVRDATHSVLSNQTVGHLREDVIDYQLRLRVAQSAI